jgi:hypothetical protein
VRARPGVHTDASLRARETAEMSVRYARVDLGRFPIVERPARLPGWTGGISRGFKFSGVPIIGNAKGAHSL